MVFDPAEIRKKAFVPMIVIYKNPADYPGKYVARLWDMNKPTGEFAVADTYEELIKEVPVGDMVRMPRHPDDDPVICEIWM